MKDMKSARNPSAEPEAESPSFAQMMNDLKPGDVITDLCCFFHHDAKVLVLGHDLEKGELWISLGGEDGQIGIVPSDLNPFRWDEEQQVWVDNEGDVDEHIGPGVKVLKGKGERELALFQALPDPQEAVDYADVLKRVALDGESGDLYLQAEAILQNKAYRSVGQAVMATVRHVLGGRECPLNQEQLARVAAVSYVAHCVEAEAEEALDGGMDGRDFWSGLSGNSGT